MEFEKHKDIQPFNTLAAPCIAELFTRITGLDQLIKLASWLQQNPMRMLVLGGGSNLVLPKVLPGLTLKMDLLGKQIVEEDQDSIVIQFSAGEQWHQAVQYCVQNGYAGIENLALIPGTMGAAPIQNIGAYGVELKDVFYSLEAFNLQTSRVETFYLKDCEFGYRHSFFKTLEAKHFIILSVSLRLKKHAQINCEYPSLKEKLSCIENPNIENVFNAVVDIRNEKLPDPEVLPNSGSFFKNPVVSTSKFKELAQKFTNIPSYRYEENTVKVPAAWLIDQLGWKGKQAFGAGVHAHQALVLINPDRVSGQKIMMLAQKIKEDVRQTYNILLEEEPLILV